ncbi:MAG: hypothetical protein ACKVU2_11155 [Saprospiraceae bacterium]
MYDRIDMVDKIMEHADAALIVEHVRERPKSGKYRLVLKSSKGSVHCHAVPGFSIPIAAIFDKKVNRKVLRDFLAQE